MASVGGSLFPLLVVLLVLLVEVVEVVDCIIPCTMTEIKEGYRPTAKPIPKGGIQTMGKVPQSRWNPYHGQSPTVKTTETKEGYRPTAKSIPKCGIQIMDRVPQSRKGINPLPSRFQKVEFRPLAESHGQVKVTGPNNCMPVKFNTKYNAKFNAKSSAMFAVRSNVWLKCIPKHSSVSSLEAKFNVELDFRVQGQVQSRVKYKVGFPSLIPSLLPEFDDKINAVPYESNYEFDSKKN
ncbi:hypothetical protein CLU79DRAFT_845437 [Phycomyces nitens]|nr:hypothetical protein CLU79DRAFT_845437 [Phycomyces nitens]